MRERCLIIMFFIAINSSVAQSTQTVSLGQTNSPDKIQLVLPPNYDRHFESGWMKSYLPAIVTAIAGIASVLANLYISGRLRESTADNIRSQLAEARKLKLAEIKASINTKNRQDWMNQFRDTIAEYISLVNMFGVNFPVKEGTGLDYIQKFLHLITRINLLLHPERPDENEAIEKIKLIVGIIMMIVKEEEKENKPKWIERLADENRELTDISRKILERNWRVINNPNLDSI